MEAEGPHSLNDKELISAYVARVDVKPDHLAVQLSAKSGRHCEGQDFGTQQFKTSAFIAIHMYWSSPGKRRRQNDRERSFSPRRHPLIPTPVQSEPKPASGSSYAIAKGRHWLDELIAGTVTNVEQIAATENCTVRQINMTISLAFLAPNLVQAAVDGRLPRGVGIANLRDAPAAWSRQYARLGLAS